ncbi:MAG: desulfoferrodoxin [Clostridiales bacterium]|nr:desulfoferrodoxin [Clostridiales bacterium]
MTEPKFYICRHCGNIIAFVKASGVPVVCCGEKMQEIVPNTTDAATEKHVPVITVDGNKVTVKIGSVTHPMTEEHYITWILLRTEQGNQRKELKPGDAPEAVFALADGDKAISAYAYCNLHGLWKSEV